MDIWIGTSGFQYPEWKGKFYPEKLPASKMLPFYAERFSSTEINYSFRRIPSEKAIQSWASSTPDHFKFSFKAPQKVTHFARLRDCGETMQFFHRAIAPMGRKLGCVLIQLPPGFKSDASRLHDFLDDLPTGMRIAFEFRDESWFEDETYGILRKFNAALCLAESEDLATPLESTADFGCLRLRRLDYSADDIHERAEFVKSQAKHWGDAFIYFKHEETCAGPGFARQMLDALN